MMYKVTIFERYTQHSNKNCVLYSCCYDVQSYNFWKIYTTEEMILTEHFVLLWCTKLQFLKDIHNSAAHVFIISFVVMMYKVTIFERYTQLSNSIHFSNNVVMMYKVTIFERYTQLKKKQRKLLVSCYDVQSYNFWKIYTTLIETKLTDEMLLWCTKLQFLKDIHNKGWIYPQRSTVVMMYKVTIFERYTQLIQSRLFAFVSCYDVQSYNFWKIYTTIYQGK